jgi:cytochrome c oxidase subunit III
MATLTRSADLEVPRAGDGGGAAEPPVRPGGGDDGHGVPLPGYLGRLRRARLGLLVGLASVTMIFVAFTSAYVVRQGLPTYNEVTGKYVRDWMPVDLPVRLLLVNTALLLVSTLTMELARRRVTRQAALAPVEAIPGVSLGREPEFPWLGATILLGFGFLAGQWMAWRELQGSGFGIAWSPSSSFVYVLTVAHAIHLAGGLVALLAAGAMSVLRKSVEHRRIVVDVAGWYWHFMGLLWVYVFALLYFAK